MKMNATANMQVSRAAATTTKVKNQHRHFWQLSDSKKHWQAEGADNVGSTITCFLVDLQICIS